MRSLIWRRDFAMQPRGTKRTGPGRNSFANQNPRSIGSGVASAMARYRRNAAQLIDAVAKETAAFEQRKSQL
ncbi:MAG TPA: hypothetical protein VH331_14110 [Allosphingosinicella sp.]|nr:hypothetical protein [Allosphingosinicella sp.]